MGSREGEWQIWSLIEHMLAVSRCISKANVGNQVSTIFVGEQILCDHRLMLCSWWFCQSPQDSPVGLRELWILWKTHTEAWYTMSEPRTQEQQGQIMTLREHCFTLFYTALLFYTVYFLLYLTTIHCLFLYVKARAPNFYSILWKWIVYHLFKLSVIVPTY